MRCIPILPYSNLILIPTQYVFVVEIRVRPRDIVVA